MKVHTIHIAAALVIVGATASGAYAQNPAAALFQERCSSCHADSAAASAPRAPERAALREKTPETIFDALTTGIMTAQADGLTEAQRRGLAEFAAGRAFGVTRASMDPKTRCATSPPVADLLGRATWNGWGNDATNSRFQPADAAGITPADLPRLKLKWAFGFPGGSNAYGQPTVAGGRLFVGSDNGFVYSLDAQTGCTYWARDVKAAVRTAIVLGKLPAAASGYAAYFGDARGNITAVDAATGDQVWTMRADPHRSARITAAPTLVGDRLIVAVSSLEEGPGGNANYECCTFRGSVLSLDAATGRQIWKSYTIADPPKPTKKNVNGVQQWGPAGAAIWSSPTVDVARKIVFVTTGNTYSEPAADTSDAVLAFDLDTGRRLWARQVTEKDVFVTNCGGATPRAVNCANPLGPDFDFGSSAILRGLPNARQMLVVGQKSGIVSGLDPENGRIVWQRQVGRGSALGGIEWGMAADNERLYVPLSDVIGRGSEPGGLFALSIATGEVLWRTPSPIVPCTNAGAARCSPAQSAAISVVPGLVFSGALNGYFRAYSTTDGHILWEVNTAQEFPTVNGVPAKGGSMNGAGPTIANGMVFVNSGYGSFSQMGGNVLLAFGLTP